MKAVRFIPKPMSIDDFGRILDTVDGNSIMAKVQSDLLLIRIHELRQQRRNTRNRIAPVQTGSLTG